MIRALVFLVFHSGKNRLQYRIRRLRQPKYLAGALIGGLYFWLVFLRGPLFSHFGAGHQHAVADATRAATDPMLRQGIGALALFVMAILTWVLPQEPVALTFTEAEVAFLFPAPVARRTLIHWMLLRSQVGILITAIIFTFVFGWARSGAGPAWTRTIGWWVIFSTIRLHGLGSSFARTLILDRGISNAWRRAGVLFVVATAATTVGWWAWRSVPSPPRGAVDFESLKYYFEQLLTSGPMPYLLYPFRVVVRPYLSLDGATFLRAIGPALVLMALHYVWVIRADVAFEEASIESSRRRAERLSAMRAGRLSKLPGSAKPVPPPFMLASSGRPFVALLWKNLIGVRFGLSTRSWLLLAGTFIAAMGFAGRANGVREIAGSIMLMVLVMSFMIGPQIVRDDFRKDLPMADQLKTYPLPAWQVALGELLAPAMILTAIQWSLILATAVTLTRFDNQTVPVAFRGIAALSLAVVVPTLNVLVLLIPNAAVLWLPSWFQSGPNAPTGVEATGQRLIFIIGQLVVLALGLLPPSLVGALVWYVGSRVGGWQLATPLAAMASSTVLAAEGGLGLLLLGRLFDRLDISTDGAAP